MSEENSRSSADRRARWLAGVTKAIFVLSGLPVDVHGNDNLPQCDCVVVSNHASYVDGFLLKGFLPGRFSFVIKGEMRSIPVVHFLLRRAGSRFVDRGEALIAGMCLYLCDGNAEMYEYLLDWIATKIQHPTRVMGVMPVFIAGQGIGKGVIFEELLMRIFGQHGLAIEDSSGLLGKHNQHLMDVCYLFADEAFFAGNKRDAQKMKRRITAPTIIIEPKGVDSMVVPSYLGIIAATNESHAVHVEHDDRRTVAMRSSDARKGDTEYFKTLRNHINGDGAAHFLEKMLRRDRGANPRRGVRNEGRGRRRRDVFENDPESGMPFDERREGSFKKDSFSIEDVAGLVRRLTMDQ